MNLKHWEKETSLRNHGSRGERLSAQLFLGQQRALEKVLERDRDSVLAAIQSGFMMWCLGRKLILP